ncbi:MAG: shikimate kinase [Planctomycetota bacterium]
MVAREWRRPRGGQELHGASSQLGHSGRTPRGRQDDGWPTLAAQLGVRFVDLDQEIERAANKSIARLFADAGEAGFRAIESQALQDLAAAAAQGTAAGVLATGGGVIIAPATARCSCSSDGSSGWMRRSVSSLRRLHDDRTRPPLTTLPLAAEIAHIVAERSRWYAAVACVTVDASAEVSEVVATVRRIASAKGIVSDDEKS